MIAPWFDPNHYAWIPGTAYGLVAGLMGGLVGWLVPRGRARNFILRAWFTVWAIAVALLIVGIVALVNGQPWGVWYGLLLPRCCRHAGCGCQLARNPQEVSGGRGTPIGRKGSVLTSNLRGQG